MYQTLDDTDARSLLYQKFLLSEDNETKVEYLFLLDELFKKNKLQNIFPKKLSDSLKDIGIENIPENYKEVAEARIMSEQEINLGKVKYNDKILHQSKIIKFYIENEEQKRYRKKLIKFLKR